MDWNNKEPKGDWDLWGLLDSALGIPAKQKGDNSEIASSKADGVYGQHGVEDPNIRGQTERLTMFRELPACS